MKKECNGVFEGGGVRGIGLAGAACALENGGYIFNNVAGSSAGAIVASLLSVGYSSEEIKDIVQRVDYKKFKQCGYLSSFGIVGKLAATIKNLGIFKTNYFELWLRGLLEKKGVYAFGDIPGGVPSRAVLSESAIKGYEFGKNKCRLQVTASDVSDKKLLILPDDLSEFGIDPTSFSVARAVRMSMSIPIFYEPCKLKGKDGRVHYIVDGGMLSNYPVWILDDGNKSPKLPVFGFRFIEETKNSRNEAKKINFLEYAHSVVSTALEAHDTGYIYNVKGDAERTVHIPVTVETEGSKHNIGATDFDITQKEASALFYNGLKAGKALLKNWNFDAWKLKYRNG